MTTRPAHPSPEETTAVARDAEAQITAVARNRDAEAQINAVARDAQALRAAAVAGMVARARAWFARCLHPGHHAH